MRSASAILTLSIIGILLLAGLIPPIINTDSIMAESGTVTVLIDSPDIVYKDDSEYFHVLVRITSVTNFDAAQYDISYNPNVIRIQNVTAGSISGTAISIESWSFVPASTQGVVRIINSISGSAGVSGEGYLADIYFKIIGEPGDSSAISFVEGIGDPAGDLILSNNAGIEISATWAGSDTIVDSIEPIPVSYPILLSPADGTTAVGTIIQGTSTSRLTMLWEDMPQVTRYEYQVAYDQYFSSIATTGTIEGTLATEDLFLGERFYWRVRVYSPAVGQWSEVWDFTTPLGASAKPILLNPSSGQGNVILNPTLQWSSSIEATGFELILAKDCNWANPVLSLTGSSALGPNTTYQIPQSQTLQHGASYCWKVRGINYDVISPWSDTGTFTTAAASDTPIPTPTPRITPTRTGTPTPTSTQSTISTPTITTTPTPKTTAIPNSSSSSTPIWLIGGIGGGIALVMILVFIAIDKKSGKKRIINASIRQLKSQMNKWRKEGYDVSDLEDLFK